VFGIDDLEIEIQGESLGTIAKCTGTAAAAPGLTFKATLILRQPQDTGRSEKRCSPSFDPNKLPKLTRRSTPR
jgi:hypothetical protein